MSNDPSDTLMPYVAENTIDYIQDQTKEKEVSSAQMKILENGVNNICEAGYPELKKEINANIAKLVRAGLDSSQLSWSDAAMKIVDPINPPKNEVIAGILNNINSIKEHGVPYQDVNLGVAKKLGEEVSKARGRQ